MSKPILAWVTRHPPTPRQRRDFAIALGRAIGSYRAA